MNTEVIDNSIVLPELQLEGILLLLCVMIFFEG